MTVDARLELLGSVDDTRTTMELLAERLLSRGRGARAQASGCGGAGEKGADAPLAGWARFLAAGEVARS